MAWDSPLTFDPRHSLSDRPIDRQICASLKDFDEELGIPWTRGIGGVSVLPFSGCPHWAISCHVLGLPFRHRYGATSSGADWRDNLIVPESSDDLDSSAVCVLEVHPAVTLAVWWLEQCETTDFERQMPRYKGSKAPADGLRRLVDSLDSIDAEVADFCAKSDDHLNAWASWKMGYDLLTDEACIIGNRQTGGYVLPGYAAQLDLGG